MTEQTKQSKPNPLLFSLGIRGGWVSLLCVHFRTLNDPEISYYPSKMYTGKTKYVKSIEEKVAKKNQEYKALYGERAGSIFEIKKIDYHTFCMMFPKDCDGPDSSECECEKELEDFISLGILTQDNIVPKEPPRMTMAFTEEENMKHYYHGQYLHVLLFINRLNHCSHNFLHKLSQGPLLEKEFLEKCREMCVQFGKFHEQYTSTSNHTIRVLDSILSLIK